MNSKSHSKSFPTAAGALVLFCTVVAASADTVVTFQVDMSNAPFDPTTQTVSVHGTFNGWDALELTNSNPGGPGVWSMTTNVPLNGVVVSYKYVIDQGPVWETVYLAGGHNRLITLPATSGASLTLPLVFFSDTTPNPVTNQVTFQVNMAQQINTGAFDPLSSVVEARGLYMGWGNMIPQTNDPTILTTNQFGVVSSSVYVYTYQIIGAPGQTMDFRYHIDYGTPLDNWESPAPGTGDPADNNNRFFNLSPGPTQTLPIVYFSDSTYTRTGSVPFIVVQPQGQVGYWGRSVTFIAGAGGAPPLEYLWYKDGLAIPWATNCSLVLTNLALDAGGNYWVVVTNAFGSITSSNAFLTVNPAGVTLGLYAGLTIEGVAGNTYGIQYATNVSPITTWTTLTQITLAQPVQLWIDTNVNVVSGDSPRRFYRVLAIP